MSIVKDGVFLVRDQAKLNDIAKVAMHLTIDSRNVLILLECILHPLAISAFSMISDQVPFSIVNLNSRVELETGFHFLSQKTNFSNLLIAQSLERDSSIFVSSPGSNIVLLDIVLQSDLNAAIVDTSWL